MREWPSIVPGAPEEYYIVINHYGEFGPAFAETDLYRANLETHQRPDDRTAQRPAARGDVQHRYQPSRGCFHAIAQEILRRLDLEGRNVPSELEDFIDRHVGRDRQLTLRLAYVTWKPIGDTSNG